MKSLKYLFLALLGIIGIAAPARADHDGWYRHHHRDRVVVAVGVPVVGVGVYEPRRYYRVHHHSLEFDVQIALSRRGYYHGPVDGDIGPGTRRAIRAYQYDRGLYVSGTIDGQLIRSLGL